MPEKVSINYDATYAELYCGSEELNEVVSKEILTTVDSIVSSIACIRKGTCTTSNVVTNCNAVSRERRSASQAGFKLSVEASSQNGKKFLFCCVFVFIGTGCLICLDK